MGNERYIQIDNYEDEFWRTIESSLDLKLDWISTVASSNLNGAISFEANLPSRNKLLEGTSYLYNESKKLIHFTSISSLFSIINEGSVRLYNLHNSNDKNEYLYASKFLRDLYKLQRISENDVTGRINYIKENSFYLSCTNHDGLYDAGFWKNYGDKGRGVAIEFEILNKVCDWEVFYCSKIHYDKLNEFDIIKASWEKLQIKNPTITYQINLDQILGLHKSKDWERESEIRILALIPGMYNNLFCERVYRDFKLNKKDFNIKYFKLPLCSDNGEFIDKSLKDRK